MAAVHLAVMRSARHVTRGSPAEQLQGEVNALNKSARTFAAQVDTLKRYRTNGEQVVKVQHVVVNDGGQAIVGNVQQGGGGARKIEG
jgi:hypothetical protein